MLPRSLFSASSLKSPQQYTTNSANNSGDESPPPRQHNSSRSRRERERPHNNTKTKSEEPSSPLLCANIESETEMDNQNYVSVTDSSNAFDSSDDQEEERNTAPLNLQDLMLQLRHQQAKQARYVEKTRKLSQRMQETSLRIAQLTGMALQGPSTLSSSSSSSPRSSLLTIVTLSQTEIPWWWI
ncbi:hypothetical protein BDB00DRAFT_822030 [Zychaea mexicana]|uniref:uncharacterized protein n=1 Tax=Zychaea mexicana TaxID=64656 RepID=UPI0022FE8687|nr:uncharacterized protein BDB00DRAFT_822030 [Zychaea mexicana]KAI9493663.1 hypothetical protein BDB00DRAFT_822030 [Zychaea mexicana]